MNKNIKIVTVSAIVLFYSISCSTHAQAAGLGDSFGGTGQSFTNWITDFISSDPASQSTEETVSTDEEIKPDPTLFEKITATEVEYGLKDGVLKRVIECESHFDPEAYGDHGVAYGIAQFHENTFDWLKDKSGMADLEYKNLNDQLELMGWAFQNGYAPHWSCWKIHSKEFSRKPTQQTSKQVAAKF